VEEISCLGRCDRAPAACLTGLGSEHECYYLQRSSDDLKETVAAALEGTLPEPDRDMDLSFTGDSVMIDPYKGDSPDYRAVRAVLAARDASLHRAMEHLKTTTRATPGMLEKFRIAAIRQLRIDFEIEPGVRESVRCWQTENGWAKGPEFGGWSQALLNELRDADLRGLGGAGIPAVHKWRDVRDAVR